MTVFHKLFGNDRLYAVPGGPGWFLLVLSSPSTQDAIKLEQAWSDPAVNLVYSAGDPGVDKAGANTFVTAIIGRTVSPGRGFVWLAEPTAWRRGPLNAEAAPMLGMNPNGTSIRTALDAAIMPGVWLRVDTLSTLTLEGDGRVVIEDDVRFTGQRAPSAVFPTDQAVLALTGPEVGTISFHTYLSSRSLHDASNWGFQFLYPDPSTARGTACQWLPLASATRNDALGFEVRIDPSDPANAVAASEGEQGVRSLLTFTGVNGDGKATRLDSGFRTDRGRGVTLVPVTAPHETHRAALVFNGSAHTVVDDQRARLTPMGDFEVVAEPTDTRLLCGLHGTEQIVLRGGGADHAGDRLRFTPYQPAYAATYPFTTASPLAAQTDLQAPLLDDTYMTSWVTVVATDAKSVVHYVAQPEGSTFYGQDNPIWDQQTGLMGWRASADALAAAAVFPLAPYSGYGANGSETASGFPPERAADFERQIVGPTRRQRIGMSAAERAAPAGPAADQESYTAVTPSGFLATIDGDRWSRLLLGQTADPPYEFAFSDPHPALREAFQTGQLFLVAANAERLGAQEPGDGTCPPGTRCFCNTVNIGGWTLTANVGTRNQYDDYRNVLIFKGRKGTLYDPRDPAGSLVANPARWTAKDLFATPSGGDPAEQVILSSWLYRYFDEAYRTGGPQLEKFNRIARDENWTGVLVLRMDIAAVPDDLVGITAGIRDRDRFAAHHLGIEIAPITNDPPPPDAPPTPPGPRLAGPSSMFGLIDYTDPAFQPPEADETPAPVAPGGGSFEFRVLSLKVVFENTAVLSFSSLAQLTTMSWFDMSIQRMGAGGNPYNAIVLEGSVQTHNGRPVYSLSSTTPATFYFANDVVDKLEIDRATLSTRSTGVMPGSEVASWFALSGFLDFRAVQGAATANGKPYSFDVFSFGSDPAAAGEQLRRGLAFGGLGVSLTFPPGDPGAAVLLLDPRETRFDATSSTPRPGSLYEQFALDVQGLVWGSGPKERPADRGYAAVATDARLTGVGGAPWWGIDYQLTMGTLGDLAGQAGLVSHLVTAWSVQSADRTGSGAPTGDDSYRAAVGLRLPGANGSAALLSLQSVLSLSLGQIFLAYDQDKEAFLLLFSEIALKLFGMLSVPPGSTLFYLFGDPDSAGAPSGLGWYAMYRPKKGSVL